MRIASPAFIVAFYYLMVKHTYVFLTVIAGVLPKRFGVTLATVWTLIGIIITMNVVWNHLLAMCVKPNGPSDLKVTPLLFSFSLRSGPKLACVLCLCVDRSKKN